MAVKYALELLVPLIAAQLATDWGNSTSVPVVFGATEPRKNINIGTVGRVVISDCDIDGDVGEIEDAEQWPEPADPLFNLKHVFLIYVFAVDTTDIDSAEAQYHMGMKVLTEVLRAVYRATHNDPPKTSQVLMGKPRRIKPEAQLPYGREYVIRCTIAQPILDAFDADFEFVNVAPADADITETHESTTDVAHMRQAIP